MPERSNRVQPLQNGRVEVVVHARTSRALRISLEGDRTRSAWLLERLAKPRFVDVSNPRFKLAEVSLPPGWARSNGL